MKGLENKLPVPVPSPDLDKPSESDLSELVQPLIPKVAQDADLLQYEDHVKVGKSGVDGERIDAVWNALYQAVSVLGPNHVTGGLHGNGHASQGVFYQAGHDGG